MTVEALVVAFLGLALSALSKKLKLSTELFLVVVAGVVSFLPFIPRVELDGHLLMTIILPPLLFSAARNLGGYKFSRMRNPILWLGFGLIVITAFVVAIVISTVVGFFTLTAGLILGAVVAPPDAVSSVSIGKKLGLPDRVMTILTGESLINDAAALTLFSFAVSIYYGHENEYSFLTNPVILLAWVGGAGLIMGTVLGFAVVGLRRMFGEPNIIAVFTALAPWGIYVACEHIGASGVIGVVISGFIIEKSALVRSSYATRLNETSLWHSIETLLDTFVFTYIGLQVNFLIHDLVESELDIWYTLSLGVLVLLIVMVVRPCCVLGYNALRIVWYKMQYRHLAHFVSGTNFGAKRGMDKKITSKAMHTLVDAPVSWREYLILSWTGMRGVVTLATASAVPLAYAGEMENPLSDHFKVHVFIQIVGLIVTFGTLLLQGLTLPVLIPKIMGRRASNAVDPLEGQWNKARTILDMVVPRPESFAPPD